jgi:tRNA A58 N-methylase Trm61
MHFAPKQFPANARANLKNAFTNEQIVQAIGEIEAKIKEVEPKVDMIFLETSSLNNSSTKKMIPKHIG